MTLGIICALIGCVLVSVAAVINRDDMGQPYHLLVTALSAFMLIFGSMRIGEVSRIEYETHTTTVKEKNLVSTKVTESGDTVKVYKNAKIK